MRAPAADYSIEIYEMMTRLGIEPGAGSFTAVKFAVCNGAVSMRHQTRESKIAVRSGMTRLPRGYRVALYMCYRTSPALSQSF